MLPMFYYFNLTQVRNLNPAYMRCIFVGSGLMAKKKKKKQPENEADTPSKLNQQAFSKLKDHFRPASSDKEEQTPPPPKKKAAPAKKTPLRRRDLPENAEKPEVGDEKLFSWWMRGTTPLEETKQGRSFKKSRDRSIVENEARLRKHAMMAGVPDEEQDRAFIDVMQAEDDPSLFAEAVDPIQPGERLARKIRREEERLFAEAIEKLDDDDMARHARHEEPKEDEPDVGIEDRLDLHGLSKESALRFLDSWLWTRHLEGARKVLIVTGKGNKSPQGTGVLRDRVKQYFNENPRRIIRSFERAKGSEGGRGAWVVELKPR